MYLDKLVDVPGAESPLKYEKKVQCCGSALAFSEPEKSQDMVRDIIEATYGHGAEMIVAPCRLCRMNTLVYQEQIIKVKKLEGYRQRIAAVESGSFLGALRRPFPCPEAFA